MVYLHQEKPDPPVSRHGRNVYTVQTPNEQVLLGDSVMRKTVLMRLKVLGLLILVTSTCVAVVPSTADNEQYQEIAYSVLEEILTYPIPGLWGALAGGILDWYFSISLAGATRVSVSLLTINYQSTAPEYLPVGKPVTFGIRVWTGDESGSFKIDIKIIKKVYFWEETVLTFRIYNVPGGLDIKLASTFTFKERGDYKLQVIFRGNSWMTTSSDSFSFHIV